MTEEADVTATHLGAGSHKGQARGQGERLLGASDRHVHLPLVKLELQGANRGHAVHQQQRRVAAAVHHLRACTGIVAQEPAP